MSRTSIVTLPGGLWIEGTRCQEAVLRSLTGEDEALFGELGASMSPAGKVTALLARCLECLGPVQPVPEDIVRALTVGDREALILHLRRLSYGSRMQCVLDCPYCGEKLEIELQAADLLVAPYARFPQHYEAVLEHAGSSHYVEFRLPTGVDQEMAAEIAHHSVREAADWLLRQCILESVIDGTPADSAAELPDEVASQLSDLIAERDTQAEIMLSLMCAVCGNEMQMMFDSAGFFFQEIESRNARLYHEVHLLAYHYHWSETEIMAMPWLKRRMYLNLLVSALNQESVR